MEPCIKPWRRSLSFLLAALLCVAGAARAQDTDGPMSEAEVESLRDSADSPVERIAAFIKILDARQKRIDELVARHRVGMAEDLHDALDQFGGIADELNDNLDEYRARHRDIRKALPKLLKAVDRWATSLRAPPQNDAYQVVRKIALDHVNDMRGIAQDAGPELEAYFKAHPEAEKAEKTRSANPHAPTAN